MRASRVLKSAPLALISAFIFLASPSLAAPTVTVPDVPNSIQATRGNASATIRWSAPSSDGGSAITSYRILGTNGVDSLTASPASSATSYTFTKLTNNSSYNFAIYALNSAGQSTSSSVVTVVPSSLAPKVPSPPSIQTVDTSVSRTLSVNFALGNSNGSTITDLSYSMDAGATWQTATSNPIVISGLTNGFGYAFRLRSTNYFGNSTLAAKTLKPVATPNVITLTSTPMNSGSVQSLSVQQTGGQTVVTTSTPSVCSVSGYSVTALKAGTCTLTASNAGNAIFAAAKAVKQSIVVSKASVTPSPSATATATASATPTSSPGSIACAQDPDQLCGPLSNVSVSVDGVTRAVTAGGVSVDVGRPVQITYTSNSANSGKRVLITLDGISSGVTSSVPHADGISPWSSSSCYPDGSNRQCQLMLDANGNGYFTATFAGATVGSSFEIRQKGPGYSTDAITATFKATGSTPTATPSASPTASATPTVTATPTATPTPAAGGPWTIRQTTFSNTEFAQNTGDAALWVSYGWYANGLHYGTVHLPVASTKTVSFHVTDKFGAVAANKSVTLILGKGYSNSTSHVRVGSVATSGWDPGTGVHQATVSSLTDASGNVSFAIINTDGVGSNLYTQISAYVNNVGTDIVDIINIAYDQAAVVNPTPNPTSSASMVLLWQDDFNGTAGTGPNSSFWATDLEDGCSSGNCGWGNGEREWYTSAANKLNGSSNLVITANKLSSSTAPNCYYGKCEWSSGKITTYNKVNFTYGYLEARIKNPAGGGTWPAFWMLGNDIGSRPWPLCGEIDIMEGEGNAPYTNWGTAHWANTNQWDHIQGPGNNTVSLSTKLSDAYHTYGILWTPTSLTWYLDGNAQYTLNKSSVPNNLWPFGPTASGGDPKFYAILNVAMGGGMGGAIDPALTTSSMTVDYLKFYSVNGQGKVTLLP